MAASNSRSAHRAIVAAAAIVSTLAMAAPSAGEETISAERLRAHTRHLASDELGGRAPGSPGEALTLSYLQREFESYGFTPGADGAFLQEVPLVGFTVTNAPQLDISDGSGQTILSLPYGTDFVGWTLRQVPQVAIDGVELVFVGYGVVAPEYDWDDYGDVDVAGRFVVMLVGDPPHAGLFADEAMTYYGRWTYKFETAAARGAAGAILVHDTDGAGYGWGVVENSWSGEQFNVVLEDKGASRCVVESWITGDAADRLFATSGHSLREATEDAASRRFRPFSLGVHGSVRIETRLRSLVSNNFLARLPGNHPERADECIVYCAHWDHLGVGKPIDGDDIYNGALDNATGVAGMLEIARVFGEHRTEIDRSIVFFIPTAEESGLLGASYYTDHPLYSLEKTVAMVNVDGLNVWGRTADMIVVGHGQSELDAMLEEVLAASGRRVVPDREPEKGFYYRSDHFAFAKKGVPALYADSGVDIIGKPAGWGIERRREYNRERYHTPFDEYRDDWVFTGAAEDMEALFRVGMRLATSQAWPSWSKTSEFWRIRERAMSGAR